MRTVELPNAASVPKLVGGYAGSVILNCAVAAAVVDRDVYFGGAGIQGIDKEAAGYGLERGDDHGGLDLVDDIAGQLANGHGLRASVQHGLVQPVVIRQWSGRG